MDKTVNTTKARCCTQQQLQSSLPLLSSEARPPHQVYIVQHIIVAFIIIVIAESLVALIGSIEAGGFHNNSV